MFTVYIICKIGHVVDRIYNEMKVETNLQTFINKIDEGSNLRVSKISLSFSLFNPIC